VCPGGRAGGAETGKKTDLGDEVDAAGILPASKKREGLRMEKRGFCVGRTGGDLKKRTVIEKMQKKGISCGKGSPRKPAKHRGGLKGCNKGGSTQSGLREHKAADSCSMEKVQKRSR